jgi:hypothetical protein
MVLTQHHILHHTRGTRLGKVKRWAIVFEQVAYDFGTPLNLNECAWSIDHWKIHLLVHSIQKKKHLNMCHTFLNLLKKNLALIILFYFIFQFCVFESVVIFLKFFFLSLQ